MLDHNEIDRLTQALRMQGVRVIVFTPDDMPGDTYEERVEQLDDFGDQLEVSCMSHGNELISMFVGDADSH